MRTEARRLTKITGAVLALTSGALVVLGATPASAASTSYWVQSSIRSSTPPPYDSLVANTRPTADQRCVAAYGLRARGVTPEAWGGGANNWQVFWRCDSN